MKNQKTTTLTSSTHESEMDSQENINSMQVKIKTSPDGNAASVQKKYLNSQRPKYRTQNNYNYLSERNEFKYQNFPDMTLPNEAYSITEILDRFTKGLPLPGYEPLYANPEDFHEPLSYNDVNTDKFDVMNEAIELNERIAENKRQPKKANEPDKQPKESANPQDSSVADGQPGEQTTKVSQSDQ